MSAAERASEASSAEQANESAVRVNEQTEEQMARHSTRRFHSHSTQRAKSEERENWEMIADKIWERTNFGQKFELVFPTFMAQLVHYCREQACYPRAWRATGLFFRVEGFVSFYFFLSSPII